MTPDPFLEMPWFPLWLAHILRGACILIGPLCILLSAHMARVPGVQKGQQFRYAGLSFLLMGMVYTEILRWDDVVTPRLFIFVLGAIFSFLGLWVTREAQYRK